ncbi:MAG: hypothetical protein ABF449_11935 [Ethanoligenens sp.]
MKRIEPFFMLAHGVQRVDERVRLCDPQPPSVERRSESIWSPQDFVYLSLGGVDEFWPVSGGSDMDHAHETGSDLIGPE